MLICTFAFHYKRRWSWGAGRGGVKEAASALHKTGSANNYCVLLRNESLGFTFNLALFPFPFNTFPSAPPPLVVLWLLPNNLVLCFSDCSGLLSLTDSNATIQSPGYPCYYGGIQRCRWSIIPGRPTSAIWIFFEEFRLSFYNYESPYCR